MKHGAFDEEHRLSTNKIIKKLEGKVTIEIAILRFFQSTFFTSIEIASNFFNRYFISRFTSSSGHGDELRSHSGNPPTDFDILPNGSSSHGFLSTEREVEIGTVTDDDVTITFGGKNSILLPQKILGNVPESNGNNKASHILSENVPDGHLDLEMELSPDAFFNAEGINVLSGNIPLFDQNGLKFQLRRWETAFMSEATIKVISYFDNNIYNDID